MSPMKIWPVLFEAPGLVPGFQRRKIGVDRSRHVKHASAHQHSTSRWQEQLSTTPALPTYILLNFGRMISSQMMNSDEHEI